MERQRLYCVFDKKAETYFAPYAVRNDAVADRRFGELLVAEDSVLSKHPEDYALYCVGEFDEYSGDVVPFEKGKVCVNEGMVPGRPQDVAVAEEEAMRKFGMWLASRGMEQVEKNGRMEIRQLDRGARL